MDPGPASATGTHDLGAVTEEDWQSAQRRVVRLKLIVMVLAVMVMPAVSVAAALVADATSHGSARIASVWGWAFVLLAPLILGVLRFSVGQQRRTDEMVAALTHNLADALARAESQADHQDVQVRRQQFERRLSNALDMAEGEAEVVEVIERSLAATLPSSPAELLLADNSHAHLLRIAVASATGEAPGCDVESPDRCPAARRAQAQHFDDSEALDACPKLRGRTGGAVSAVCVPVSIMGRTVGVIHATGPVGDPPSEAATHDLATVSNLAGARIGLLRVMAETQLQANTDTLTGLLNRRSFEHGVTQLRARGGQVAVAMGDLDHFKTLNDTYGHDTGDRALRLFAQVLTESVRSGDLVCRHGGEEVAIAFGGCPVDKAMGILDGIRAKLDAAITVAGLPRFTVSFGVTGGDRRDELPTLLARADGALMQAKRAGRNQVVVAGGPADEPAGPDAHPAAAPTLSA